MDAKLLIFDFGGTIDTDGIHWSELFWEYYLQQNININKDLFNYGYVNSQKYLDSSNKLVDKTLKDTIFTQLCLQNYTIFEKTNKHYLKLRQIDIITDNIYNFVTMTINKAIVTIEKLKTNRKLAIVSNFNGNLQIVCDEFKITNYFDYLIDSAIVKLWKPDPKIFEHCLLISGFKAEESVVIGDSYSRDIVPAKSLGCQTIWLNKNSWEKPEITNDADLIINSFEELNKIFHVL